MNNNLLKVASLVEAATGVALFLAPAVVLRLLFGDVELGLGKSVGRVAGLALLSLGVACWPRQSPHRSADVAMLLYNAGTVALLFVMGLQGQQVGIALWPGVILHLCFTVAFLIKLARSNSPHSSGP